MADDDAYQMETATEPSESSNTKPEVESETGQIGETNQNETQIQYGIEDIPPWYLWILLGFQVRIIEICCLNSLYKSYKIKS